MLPLKTYPLEVEVDWIQLPLQKERGPNGVEVRILSHKCANFDTSICVLPRNFELLDIYNNASSKGMTLGRVAFYESNHLIMKILCWDLGCTWAKSFKEVDSFWVAAAVRKHPIILPHKLVCESCWPTVPEADVTSYWNHLSEHGSPLANISPGKNHIPLWLWGDEAQYRENGDEILLIAMGCIIDQRKFSVESCYPLAICRSDSFQINSTCFILLMPCFFSLHK